jgi:hypothetical protein
VALPGNVFFTRQIDPAAPLPARRAIVANVMAAELSIPTFGWVMSIVLT